MATNGGIAVNQRGRRAQTVLLGIIAVVLLGWTLRATYLVSMPLACAVFLAMLVHPLDRWLAPRLPARLRWLSLVVTMLVILAGLALAVLFLWLILQLVIAKAPTYQVRVREYWHHFVLWARQHDIPVEEQALQRTVVGDGAIGLVTGALASALSVFEVLGVIAIVFFLALLMLVEARDWEEKSRYALRWRHHAMVMATVESIAKKVRRYLLNRTIISAISGIAEAAWLLVLGADFAFVWGAMFFLLNFLPTVGSIIAVILPTLLVVVQHGVAWALLWIGGFIVIEQIIGNVIDPRLQGKSLKISSTVLLLAIVFWGWVWGVVGMLLAVPMTVTLIIICWHVEALRPLALFLSRSPDETLESEVMGERRTDAKAPST